MNEIKRTSVHRALGKTFLFGLIAYVILTIIISFIIGIQMGWIIGLGPVIIGMFVYMAQYIYARSLGLKAVTWDSSTLNLHYGDKVVSLNIEEIQQIEQKYDISSKFGFTYKPVFTISQNDNKIKINLTLFPQYKDLMDALNIQIAKKERLQLEALLRQNQSIKDCQYEWESFKLTFDITQHQIIFKHAYLKTIIDLNHVKQMIVDDIESPLNHQRLRRWKFEEKGENNGETGVKVIFDNFIAQSKQKQEIREAIITTCKMLKIPVKLNLDETRCFE